MILKTSIRASSLCIAFVALTGQTLPPALADDDSQNFCTRLGRNMGLGESKLARTSWEAHALNFGQRFLVGGTAAISLDVEPVEPSTAEDYKRALDMCEAEKKGAVCRLTGPANFKFGWKGNQTVTPVLPNETAVVRVEGIKTTCQLGGAVSKD